ncbi:hypothetical protein [Streptomyces goshikiensis]|uniref:hypothetical protein n=1 Tax=Streptomyces goshikiensis TaxID=1942 RepID=UPI0036D05F70
MGKEVGARAAAEFTKAGWAAADTRVISAWKQDVTVCGDRVNAAKQGCRAAPLTGRTAPHHTTPPLFRCEV